ncbi:PucR family transcriptional regulator [Saxibacter everestensis]|uniref:PucR family transcriptional regulator n=1 Tax=Saxibacter everestensis TaxID=2909229 RepID=A0ABY8QTM2_9MICO|nr:PucR family transcriptional regulator [Brevibacteriaceae bacterium ZFBP1038]
MASEQHTEALAGADPATPLGLVSLKAFLAEFADRISVVHEVGDPRFVRWVEPSELADPAPYLVDDEVVLTAGMPFLEGGAGPATVDRYVRRLVGANVSALGFGVTPYHDELPEQLISACKEHGLTLFRIPADLPFVALGVTFSRLLESENARAIRALAEANRRMMRAVLTARPEHGLLSVLTTEIPCWARVYDASGRRRAASGEGFLTKAQLQPILDSILGGGGPRIELKFFDTPGARTVYGYPLRSLHDSTLGVLIIGADTNLSPAQNNLVSAAIGLLELRARQRISGSLAPGQLAAALTLEPDCLIRGADSGQPLRTLTQRTVTQKPLLRDSAERLFAKSISAAFASKARVVHGEWRHPRLQNPCGGAETTASELLELRRLFDSKLVTMTDERFVAVTRLDVDRAVISEAEARGWRLIISEPVPAAELPEAHQRAAAISASRRSDTSSVSLDGLAWSVSGLLGDQAGDMLARRLFAPLQDVDPDRRRLLLDVLRTWLEANGNWDATAKASGLHRNSVRRHIGSIGELLELDMNDAHVRMNLLAALGFVGD